MTGIILSQFYLLPYILSPSSYTFHHYRFYPGICGANDGGEPIVVDTDGVIGG